MRDGDLGGFGSLQYAFTRGARQEGSTEVVEARCFKDSVSARKEMLMIIY